MGGLQEGNAGLQEGAESAEGAERLVSVFRDHRSRLQGRPLREASYNWKPASFMLE